MKIMLVAGEASGDILGGALAKALTSQKPDVSLYGMGGECMREAGVKTAVDISETAVAGIVEIARHYPRLRGILNRLTNDLKQQKPSLLVLIDYPEFNLKLAKQAKQLGIPVLYYVSPQLWAWRSGRIKHIQERVKLMAVLLPFEVDFYQSANVPVRLVRHPLLEQVTPENQYPALRAEFNVPEDHRVVTLLPGSRNSEIRRLLPLMAACASRLKKQHPKLTFILPIASTVRKDEVDTILHPCSADIRLIEQRAADALCIADAAIVASGTATLQTALAKTPMVITYKVSPISYSLLRSFVRVDHIGLANIVLDQRCFQEFVQEQATEENICAEVSKILTSETYRDKLLACASTLSERMDRGISNQELAIEAIKIAKNT